MPNKRLFTLFTLLYFAQGAIASYQLNFFKPHLHSAGIPTQQIATLASLALLPFVVKVLYGLLSDRINLFGYGHRVPYMLVGVIGCAIAFLGLFFVEPGAQFLKFAILILLASFTMALFDANADAYAVETIDNDNHATVQSYMTIGRATGFTVLSVAFGLMAANVGYNSIFIVIFVSLLLPLIMLLNMQESATLNKRKSFEWKAFASLIKPINLLLCVILVITWFLFQGIDGTITFYLSKSLGADNSIISLYGSIKGIGMIIGAILVFVSCKHFGLVTTTIVTMALVSLSGLSASYMQSVSAAPLVAILTGVTSGFHWTIWMTVIMKFTDLRIAGSMIAIFQIMANVGIAAGEGIATNLTDSIGFNGVFIRFALANVLIIPIVYFLLKKSNT